MRTRRRACNKTEKVIIFQIRFFFLQLCKKNVKLTQEEKFVTKSFQWRGAFHKNAVTLLIEAADARAILKFRMA